MNRFWKSLAVASTCVAAVASSFAEAERKSGTVDYVVESRLMKLVGFKPFVNPPTGTEPVRYLKKAWTGDQYYAIWEYLVYDSSGSFEVRGAVTFDPDKLTTTSTLQTRNLGPGPTWSHPFEAYEPLEDWKSGAPYSIIDDNSTSTETEYRGEDREREKYTPPVGNNVGFTEWWRNSLVCTLSVPYREEDAKKRAEVTKFSREPSFDNATYDELWSAATGTDLKKSTYRAKWRPVLPSEGECGCTYVVHYKLYHAPVGGGATVSEDRTISAPSASTEEGYIEVPLMSGMRTWVGTAVDVEAVGEGCSSCSSESNTASPASSKLGSVQWAIDLGRDPAKRSLGVLQVQAETLDSSLDSSSAVVFVAGNSSAASVVAGSAPGFRQVLCPDYVVQIEQTALANYVVSLFRNTQISGQNPDGTKSFTGTAYLKYTFARGTSGADRLYTITKITEGGHEIATEYKEVVSADPTRKEWILSEGSGLRKVHSIETPDLDNPDQVIRVETVSGADDVVVAKKREVYSIASTPRRLLSRVRDPDGVALTEQWEYDNQGMVFQYYAPDGTRTHFSASLSTSAGCFNRVAEKYAPDEEGYTSILTEVQRSGSWGGGINYESGKRAEFASVKHPNRGVTRRYKCEDDVRIYRSGIWTGGDATKRQFFKVIESQEALFWGDDTYPNYYSGFTAAWGEVGNRVTKERAYADGRFSDQVAYRLNPDGRLQLFAYFYDAVTGRTRTETYEGEASSDKESVVAGTHTTRIVDEFGNFVSAAAEDIGSGTQLWSEETLTTDPKGRPWDTLLRDGTTETRTYDPCCGRLASVTRHGVTTQFGYDDLGRQDSETIDGVTRLYKFDAENRLRKTIRRGRDLTEQTIATHEYNLAGQLKLSTDALGRETKFAETFLPDGATSRTTEFPDGRTLVEVSNPDGSLRSRSGKGVEPRTYLYEATWSTYSPYGTPSHGVSSVTEFLGSDETATEWRKSYPDALGRLTRTEFADSSVAKSFYNAKDQLVADAARGTTAEPGTLRIFTYDPQGRRALEVVDMDGDTFNPSSPLAAIDYAGTDRITGYSYAIATVEGRAVERVTTRVWPTLSQDTPQNYTIDERSFDGLFSRTTTEGLVETTTTAFGTGSAKTVTVVHADGSTHVEKYEGDRLKSRTWSAGTSELGKQSFEYDEFDRLEKILDASVATGDPASVADSAKTIRTYWNDDSLKSVTTPDPDTGSTAAGHEPATTTFFVELGGSQLRTVLPDGLEQFQHTTYLPSGGKTVRNWGARVTPTETTFDPQGRMSSLKTFQVFPGDFDTATGGATTTWGYDSTSGYLATKTYQGGKGPSFTFYKNGRMKTRTWARGVVTTYLFDRAGGPASVTYSDSTPAVTIVLDRLGRPATVDSAAGLATFTNEGLGQRVTSESYSGGWLDTLGLGRDFDSLHRWSGVTPTGALPTVVSYGDGSRVETVESGVTSKISHKFEFQPLTDSVQTITHKKGGTTALTTAFGHDRIGRSTSVSSSLQSVTYSFNGAGQRARTTDGDGNYWAFGYETNGGVNTAQRHASDDTAMPGFQFGYTFDSVGNRTTATVNGRTATYGPNLLNQYDSRDVPGAVDVVGTADAGASVLVNSVAPARNGEWFHRAVPADNSTAPVSPELRVVAAKAGSGTGGLDAAQSQRFKAWLPQTPESFDFDDDGNLTGDARWIYTWDGENRLRQMETKVAAYSTGAPRQKLTFGYDWQSRRARKQVAHWDASAAAWTGDKDLRFVWDGWRLAAEYSVPDGSTTPSLLRNYVWGLDLSGSFDGAGGVGGLLAVLNPTHPTDAQLPLWGANGNVEGYFDTASANRSASTWFGPFGEVVAQGGLGAEDLPLRFSTKYEDAETGSVYFGFRFYSPTSGRWLSRDPIEESGGVNLFGLAGNDPLNSVDSLGLALVGVTDIPRIMRANHWDNGASLMEHWFGRTGTTEKTTIKMSWALGFARFKAVYDDIVSNKLYVNSAARRAIATVARRTARGTGIVDFGSVSGDPEAIDRDSVQFRTVGSINDPVDDMSAALGHFTLKVFVQGKATIRASGDIGCIGIKKIGLYIRDDYNFRGDQALGYWDSTTNYGGKNPFSGTAVGNSDFRATGAGSDFIVYSDIKEEAVTPMEFFNVE